MIYFCGQNFDNVHGRSISRDTCVKKSASWTNIVLQLEFYLEFFWTDKMNIWTTSQVQEAPNWILMKLPCTHVSIHHKTSFRISQMTPLCISSKLMNITYSQKHVGGSTDTQWLGNTHILLAWGDKFHFIDCYVLVMTIKLSHQK